MNPVFVVTHLHVDAELAQHTNVILLGVYNSIEKAIEIMNDSQRDYEESLKYLMESYPNQIKYIDQEVPEAFSNNLIKGYVYDAFGEHYLLNGYTRDPANPNILSKKYAQNIEEDSGVDIISIERTFIK